MGIFLINENIFTLVYESKNLSGPIKFWTIDIAGGFSKCLIASFFHLDKKKSKLIDLQIYIFYFYYKNQY